MSKLDWDLFKDFFHPSWHDKMQGIIESPEVYKIYQRLKGETEKIVPLSKDTFACFQVDLSNLRVVLFGQSPYPQYDFRGPRASGLSFDCTNYGKVSPSLEKLYDAWENDCYDGLAFYNKNNLSLEYLQNQYVMLANTSLTCLKDQPKSHEDLWLPFWKQVFEKFFLYHSGLIFILLGKDAEILENFCNPALHHILKAEHPAAASYEKRAMKHNNVFSQCNELLKGMNNYKIMWLLVDSPF